MSLIREKIISELYDWTFTNDFKDNNSLYGCADIIIEIISKDIIEYIKENLNIKNNTISTRELFDYLLRLKEGNKNE